METVFSVLQQVNDYLWGFVVITALVLCALFFTYKIRGVQFRLWRDMFRVMLGKPLFGKEEREQGAGRQKDEPQEVNGGEGERRKIGSFHAFAVSLSSRVGTGNLAGVASAIFVGGPGAVFWMWVMALFGAATAFVEATLAQLYKKRGQTPSTEAPPITWSTVFTASGWASSLPYSSPLPLAWPTR